MRQFDHEKLDAYRAAIEFIDLAHEIIAEIRPKHRNLRDQLERASTSIVLNTAEGAGEFSPGDKVRFYRMARRSATECAAIVDICHRRCLAHKEQLSRGRTVLLRIVAMLTGISLALSPQA